MFSVRRAGLTGFSAAVLLLSALPSVPASAAGSYDIAIADAIEDEGTPLDFTVNVTWAGAHHPAFSVAYTTVPGLAGAGTDYVTTSGVLNVARDAASATISVPTIQDNIYEPNETFTVVLDPASTTANVLDGEGLGTIQNEDGVPRLSIGDATVTEGNDPALYVDALFDVTLSNTASQDVTVNFRTADDTALGGNVDFRATNGTLTFPAETNATQQIRVRVKGDTIHEGDETYFVNLNVPVNAVVANGRGVGLIHDTDPVPTLSMPSAPVNFLEGDQQHVVNLTASLSNATVSDVTFNFNTQNGSATAPLDYVDVAGGAGTIPAGSTSTQIPVTINGDTRFEFNENMFVIINGPTNAVLGNQVGELTLQNDDPIVIGFP